MADERLNPLEYAKAPISPVARRYRIGWRYCHWMALAFVTLLIAVLVPVLTRTTGHGGGATIRCASNLRQIGQGVMLYASENGGAFPDGFAALLVAQQFAPEVFICPLRNDKKATGLNLATIVKDFGLPGRCSYIYVDSGLSAKGASPDAVVAIEDPGNHSSEGANVLYADGRVCWIPVQEAMAYLNDLTAGVNPPTSKPMASGQAAKEDYEKNWRGRMPALKQKGMRLRPAVLGVETTPSSAREHIMPFERPDSALAQGE